jgi:hypothetical protein
MRYSLCLLVLLSAAVVLQVAVLPALLPPVLRPDLGLLIGMAVLALAPREFGLITLFCMGAQADLFGSARFGLLTLCYLLAAGLILLIAWRELTRGDLLAALCGGLAGTAAAHVLYCLLGRLAGVETSWGGAAAQVFALLIAAAVWGLPCMYLCGKLMYRLRVLALPIQSRWAAAAREAEARKKKAANLGF